MTSTLLRRPRGYVEVTDPDHPQRGLCGTCGVDVTHEPCATHGPAATDPLDIPPDVRVLAIVARHIVHCGAGSPAAIAAQVGVGRDTAARYLDTLEHGWKIIGRTGANGQRKVLIHSSHAARVAAVIVANLGDPPNANPFQHLLLPPLSPRDYRYLNLIALGLSNKQIGRRERVGIQTVKTHVGRLLRLLGASDRTNLIHRCWLLGVFGGIPRHEMGSNA